MSLPKTITVQYLDETVNRLTVNKKGDWIDLYAAETVTLQKGEQKLIHLGGAMKLPDGYEAHLVPRSSTYQKSVLQRQSRLGSDQTGQGNCHQYPGHRQRGYSDSGGRRTDVCGNRL